MLASIKQYSRTRCVEVASLSEEILTDLFENRICAVQVPQYASAEICSMLARYFHDNSQLEDYYHEVRKGNEVNFLQYGVQRLGVPYNTTYGKEKTSTEWLRYYEETLPTIRAVRSVCSPNLSPIDQLRLELDELWPHGASVGNFDGKKMLVGIGRIMRPETSYLAAAQPHFDSLPQRVADLVSQFAANIYLEMPSVGGELEMWDIDPLSVDKIDNADSDANWREVLPESFLIKPKVGDLILFNTRRAHAIQQFSSGNRITLQCFIGMHKNRSISVWN